MNINVDTDRIAEFFFSPQENLVFQTLSKNMKLRTYFSFWTRKEAFAKATGKSISYSFDLFDVTTFCDKPANIIQIQGKSDTGEEWCMESFEPAPEFMGSVVIKGN